MSSTLKPLFKAWEIAIKQERENKTKVKNEKRDIVASDLSENLFTPSFVLNDFFFIGYENLDGTIRIG